MIIPVKVRVSLGNGSKTDLDVPYLWKETGRGLEIGPSKEMLKFLNQFDSWSILSPVTLK